MDPDFTALASRLAARAEVLGCIILSRDGLVLGAFPPHGEQDITPGLLRFAALGDPDRGFVEFSDELWAYVREGSYAAFAVAEHGTRPGILLDYLEQALLVVEDARQVRHALVEPAHVDLSGKSVRLGRSLRAANLDSEPEFRAAVSAPPREAVGPGHRQGEAGGEDAGGGRRSEVPAVDDGALDDALAAAVAGGAATGSHREQEASDATFRMSAAEVDLPPEDEAEGPPPPPPDQHHEEWFDNHDESPVRNDHQEPEHWSDLAPERRFEPAPPPFVEAPPGVGERLSGDNEQADMGPADERQHAGEEHPSPPNPDEIDRVALAREFAQLLQEGPLAAD